MSDTVREEMMQKLLEEQIKNGNAVYFNEIAIPGAKPARVNPDEVEIEKESQ